MHPLSTTALFALAALGLLRAPALLATTGPALAQDPGADAGRSADAAPAFGDVEAWELDERWQGLLGMWQLAAYQPGTGLLPDGSVHGYLLFDEGFCSIVLHALPIVAPGAGEDMLAQAGMHRWRMTDEAVLQLAVMVAHGNMDGDLTWEPTNEPREFRVELDGDDLFLLRPDDTRLVWRRITSRAFPQAALDRMDALRSGSVVDDE